MSVKKPTAEAISPAKAKDHQATESISDPTTASIVAPDTENQSGADDKKSYPRPVVDTGDSAEDQQYGPSDSRDYRAGDDN